MTPFEQWIKDTITYVLLGLGIGVVITLTVAAVFVIRAFRKDEEDNKLWRSNREEWRRRHGL